MKLAVALAVLPAAAAFVETLVKTFVAFVAVAVGECIIVACMLLFAWRDFGGC